MKAFWIASAAAILAVTGCVKETRPLPLKQATQATTEIPAEQLLDVGVHIFNPGIPKEVEDDPDLADKTRIYPDIRKAEARYFAMQLRDTLEGTGHWGTARVVPATVVSFDLTVDGRIIESSGTTLKLAVTATDATGRAWIANKEYEGLADTRAYKDGYNAGRDPFENVYVAIADDLLAMRKTRSSADLANIRRVSELRFAADFAPVAFSQYLAKNAKTGQYRVLRLPADDDLLLQRIRQIRERDYGMIDTVSENYAAFSERLEEPYTSWRRYTYDEITAEEKLKAQARHRMALGAAAVAAASICSGQLLERQHLRPGGERRALRRGRGRRRGRRQRLSQERGVQDPRRVAEGNFRFVPVRGCAARRRRRGAYAAPDGYGGGAIHGMAPAAA